VKEEEHIFDKVRDFVKENPNKTIKDVADECEVTVKRVLSYIRDGRIEASGGMHGDVTCSKCGKPITSGRMCEKCILETNFQLNDMKPKTKGSGFHSSRK